MTTKKERLQARLKLLESDLRDSNDPKILARWPDLNNEKIKQDIEAKIAETVEKLAWLEQEGYAPLSQDEQQHHGQLHGDRAESESPRDRVVEAVRADLLRRSQLGIKKYGTTLERTDLSLKQWLQHAYEETLDQANYLKRAIIEIEQHEQEGSDAY